MSNKNVTLSGNADKQTFAVKNPTTGKIIAFINFGNEVSADVANGLSEEAFADIISKCTISKFTKATKGDAFEGLI